MSELVTVIMAIGFVAVTLVAVSGLLKRTGSSAESPQKTVKVGDRQIDVKIHKGACIIVDHMTNEQIGMIKGHIGDVALTESIASRVLSLIADLAFNLAISAFLVSGVYSRVVKPDIANIAAQWVHSAIIFLSTAGIYYLLSLTLFTRKTPGMAVVNRIFHDVRDIKDSGEVAERKEVL